MRHALHAVVLLMALTSGLGAQGGADAAWTAFIAWFRTAPAAGDPLAQYAAKLQTDGKADDQIKQELAVLTGLMAERPDWIGVYYDKVYAKPLTGDPIVDGFESRPSVLVAAAIQGMTPGDALDAGMGQGRNAVFLAQQGWTVTGFDISNGALTVSQANAREAGVRVITVNASYDAFDYGVDRWDLIVLTFAWAPLDHPAFADRIQRSLRPGGRIVVEHFLRAPGRAQSDPMHRLAPNELRERFRELEIAFYDEGEGVADWGGPGSHLVKMVAIKQPARLSGGPMS